MIRYVNRYLNLPMLSMGLCDKGGLFYDLRLTLAVVMKFNACVSQSNKSLTILFIQVQGNSVS